MEPGLAYGEGTSAFRSADQVAIGQAWRAGVQMNYHYSGPGERWVMDPR